jgi:hypothetical protein
MCRTLYGSAATVLSNSQSGSGGGSGLSECCASHGLPTDTIASQQHLSPPDRVSERVKLFAQAVLTYISYAQKDNERHR